MTTAPLLYPPTTGGRRRRRPRLATLRLVRLVREGSFPAPNDGVDGAGESDLTEARPALRSPRDVFARMQPYADRELAESFWILALDTQHRLIGNAPTVITRGILNSSLVHPREVFLAAIAASAAAIILVHNHPSGDPTPSADDRVVTDQLVAAGRLLDLPVLDHVIVGRGCLRRPCR